MFDIFASMTIISILYWLIVRGFLFRGVVWLFGFVGLNDALNNISWLKLSPITILNHTVQYSIIISFTIVLLAIITTKIKKGKDNV